MTRSHVASCYGKAYLLYLSLFSLSVSLFMAPSSTASPPKKNESAERSKKEKVFFFFTVQQHKVAVICQRGLVTAVDQYELSQQLFGQVLRSLAFKTLYL